jgi:flagellar biosynthesis chaperone FliJ
MPQYRMQTLLELRQRAEDMAKQAFSEAMQKLAAEQRELLRLEQDLERRRRERKARLDEYLTEVTQKGSGVNGLNMMYAFEKRLKDEEAQVELDIEKQKEAVKAAQKLVEQKRLEMVEASRELKAIEKHKEKWAMAVKAERDMREDLAIEEIGNALHLARNRGGGGGSS